MKRAGVIIAGECVMAPSALDIRKERGMSFATNARNGLVVVVDGVQPNITLAYDEDEGWADVRILNAEHRIHGNVRAYPGTLSA